MIRIRHAALLIGLSLLAGCEKGGPQDILGTLPGARVKFFNFGVNAPGVNFYAGDTKVTAISSTTGVESTIGTATGAAAANGQYVAVTPGAVTLTGRIAAAVDNNLPVATVQSTLETGKAYSYYMSGIYDAATKKVDAFMIEDPLPTTEVDYTVTTIRFVNAISNAGQLQLFIRNPTTGAEAPVGTPVAYKGQTQFTTFGTQSVFGGSGGSVDLVVRAPGNTAVLFTRTAVGFGAGRVYTVAARGNITVTSTTAADRPQLDLTANR